MISFYEVTTKVTTLFVLTFGQEICFLVHVLGATISVDWLFKEYFRYRCEIYWGDYFQSKDSFPL